MTKVTHPMLTRILTGAGLMAAATMSVTASILPGGALESRAASLRTDEPTTTTTAAPPVAAPEAPAAEPAATTTTTAPPASPPVPPAPPARPAATPSGHYTCPAGMDSATQYDAGPDCTADVVADPGPNNTSPNADPTLPNGPDGDQPGQTLGSTDAAYGADLTAKSCAIKPWLCGDGWTH